MTPQLTAEWRALLETALGHMEDYAETRAQMSAGRDMQLTHECAAWRTLFAEYDNLKAAASVPAEPAER